MLVDEEQVERLLRKVAHIREEVRQYTIPGDNSTPSVEDLQSVIGRMYDLSIEKYEVPFTAVHLQSMVLRYENGRAVILVRSGQPPSHQKCAAVKELCHLALDEREDWSPKATAAINDLIETFRLEIYHNGNNEPKNTVMLQEHLAFFATAELLYPEQCRDEDWALVEARKTSLQRLALARSLTPKVVWMALNPANRTACATVRKRLQSENIAC